MPMSSDKIKSIIKTALHTVLDELYQEQLSISEDTTLRSLVAKGTQQKINAAVEYLKKKGIDARAAEDAKFDPYAQAEVSGWGVYTEPGKVKDAAQILASVSKGLTFDPYAHAGK